MTQTRDHTIDPALWPEIRSRFAENMEECASGIPQRIENERARDDLNRLCRYRFSVWQIGYSMGEDLDELRPEFQDLMATWIPVMDTSVVWAESSRLLCIAYLFGHEEFLRDFWPEGSVLARTDSEPVGLRQWFADNPRYRDYRSGASVDGSDLSSRTWELIEVSEADPVAAETELREYLADWYDLSDDYSWWGSHIGGRRKPPTSYVGYWCWEAAAIARRCGVQDTTLSDTPYYPFELAHYLDR